MRRRLLIGRALIHQPRLVLLDEPTVGLDPQVRQELWALIDRCAARASSILMSTHYIEEAERLCDTVTIMSHGQRGRGRLAARPRRRARRAARRWRSTGRPRAWREVEAEMARVGRPTRRTGTSVAVLDHGRRTAAPEGERRPANLEDVFVLLTGEEIGDHAARDAREASPAGWTAPRWPACSSREIINFSSYWRSTTFSSTVEPTIYLLAFGFGFGSLVSTVAGYDYVEFVGTGTVATAVLFSSVFPAMFGTFVKYKFQRTYDAILAAPVDTEELVTGEALWLAMRAAVVRLHADARRDAVRPRPELGDARSSRSSTSIAGFGWASFGIYDRRRSSNGIENFNYVDERGDHAAVPRRRDVLPDLPACPSGRRSLAQLNPLYHSCSSSGTPSSAATARSTSGTSPFIVVFGLAMWRVAICAMQRKLID